MIGVWNAFFGWPNGGIWSNLLASLIVGVFLYFWKGRAWLKKVELHHIKIQELHERMVSNDSSDRIQSQPRRPT